MTLPEAVNSFQDGSSGLSLIGVGQSDATIINDSDVDEHYYSLE